MVTDSPSTVMAAQKYLQVLTLQMRGECGTIARAMVTGLHWYHKGLDVNNDHFLPSTRSERSPVTTSSVNCFC